MQQRKKNPKPSTTTNSLSSQGSPSSPYPVATAYRRKCGTQAFDYYWLNKDCCGLFCAVLTYFLHAYACFVVCRILIPPWMSYIGLDGMRKIRTIGILVSFLFCMISLLACIAHFKAMTTDPGAVPPDAHPLDGENDAANNNNISTNQDHGELLPPRPSHHKLCRRCNSFKPERAHHCSICNRCIVKMDHHCPWVNNCVGIGNHKFFILFIFYTSISCGVSFILTVYRFVKCLSEDPTNEDFHCLDDPEHLLYLVFLVVEAILFGLFTLCMAFDQLDVVSSKLTHIDRLKGETYFATYEKDSSYAGLLEVFGYGSTKFKTDTVFRWDCLSPFANIRFPDSVRDDIMGYYRPCVTACFSADNNEDSTTDPPTKGKVLGTVNVV